MFVYIPVGYGQEFINNCALLDEYKQKIAFVADTKLIYTNGQGFGISSNEFSALVSLVNANKEELDQKIADIELQQSGDTTEITHRLDVLEGDSTVPGSVANSIKKLEDLILGADHDELIETLDTIKEIQDWIDKIGVQSLIELKDAVDANTQAILDEQERALNAESDLERRVTNIENINVWDIYESDTVPVGPNTVYSNSALDVNNIADKENTDIVVETQDALSYFTNPANNSTIFQNISI